MNRRSCGLGVQSFPKVQVTQLNIFPDLIYPQHKFFYISQKNVRHVSIGF